jgi:hypothetical protein
MPYWIRVYNQHLLGQFSAETLRAALAGANFRTLCDQYGLDSALIGPARRHLAVELPVNQGVPLILVRYAPRPQPPLVVTEQSLDLSLDADSLWVGLTASVRARLMQVQAVYMIELLETQLTDMGLLLAYEFARWAAQRGSGIVLGLDGVWYRLNAHQAFIPLT